MARQINYDIPFPKIPGHWFGEELGFANGLRNMLEQIQSTVWRRAYPVGAVFLSANEKKPFSFGEWESIAVGISGVYGWRRVK